MFNNTKKLIRRVTLLERENVRARAELLSLQNKMCVLANKQLMYSDTKIGTMMVPEKADVRDVVRALCDFNDVDITVKLASDAEVVMKPRQ